MNQSCRTRLNIALPSSLPLWCKVRIEYLLLKHMGKFDTGWMSIRCIECRTGWIDRHRRRLKTIPLGRLSCMGYIGDSMWPYSCQQDKTLRCNPQYRACKYLGGCPAYTSLTGTQCNWHPEYLGKLLSVDIQHCTKLYRRSRYD